MNQPLLKVISGCALLLSACSSAPRESSNHAPPADKLVARVKNAPDRPAWIDLKNPFQIKDGVVSALGQTITPPGAGIEEGYIIASNVAKEALCKATQYRLDLTFQDSEEGSSTADHEQIKEIAMEICNGVAGLTQPGKRYWEKVMTSASNGDRVIVFRVFVTDTIPETKFRNLVLAAVRKQEGKGQVPKDFAKTEFKRRWPQFAKDQ